MDLRSLRGASTWLRETEALCLPRLSDTETALSCTRSRRRSCWFRDML